MRTPALLCGTCVCTRTPSHACRSHTNTYTSLSISETNRQSFLLIAFSFFLLAFFLFPTYVLPFLSAVSTRPKRVISAGSNSWRRSQGARSLCHRCDSSTCTTKQRFHSISLPSLSFSLFLFLSLSLHSAIYCFMATTLQPLFLRLWRASSSLSSSCHQLWVQVRVQV